MSSRCNCSATSWSRPSSGRGSILKRLATSSPASGAPWRTAPSSCSKKERPDGARATPGPRSCLHGRLKTKELILRVVLPTFGFVVVLVHGVVQSVGWLRDCMTPTLLEGVRKGSKLVHAKGLGAELAIDAQRLQPDLDLGLGPLVAPDAGQHMPEILAAMQEQFADHVVEPGDVKSGSPRCIRSDCHDGGFDLGSRPEDRRRQYPHDRDLSKGLDDHGERAVRRECRDGDHPLRQLALDRHNHEGRTEHGVDQQVHDDRRRDVEGQVSHQLEDSGRSRGQRLIDALDHDRAEGVLVRQGIRIEHPDAGKARHGLLRQLRHLPIELDGNDHGASTGHQCRECPGSRADLQDDIIGPDPCLLDDQLMNIQVDEEILSHAVPGRDAPLGEEAAQVRLGLTNRHREAPRLRETPHFPSSLATCLARMSVSMLTRSPGLSNPSVVTARVCGMSMTEKPSVQTSTSVRLTPSTAIDPLGTSSPVQAGSRVNARNSHSPSDRRSRSTAVVSICPCTKCPPSLSPTRSDRSKLTRSPARFPPRFVRSKVSGPAWTSNCSPSLATTVRQQPLTATLSPIASEPVKPGQASVNRCPAFSLTIPSTRPRTSTSPVNTLSLLHSMARTSGDSRGHCRQANPRRIEPSCESVYGSIATGRVESAMAVRPGILQAIGRDWPSNRNSERV